MSVSVLFIVAVLSSCVVSDTPGIIGGIFFEEAENLKSALTVSSKLYNFTASIKEVSGRGEILELTSLVCELAEEGVIGIIDGIGGRATENIQAVCDMLEMPLISIQNSDLDTKHWSLINMFPSPDVFNMALQNIILQKDWNNFTIIYVKGHTLTKVHELMKMGKPTEKNTVVLRELSGDDYRDVLTNAKLSGFTNFVVDCPTVHLETILRHAQQVGLMADEHSYIFVSPDLFTIDLTRYRYGGVNMTGFRLTDLKRDQRLWEFVDLYNNETGDTLESDVLETKVILVHDAVKTLYSALSKLRVQPQSLSCESYDAWTYGSSVMNFIKTINYFVVSKTDLACPSGTPAEIISKGLSWLVTSVEPGSQELQWWECESSIEGLSGPLSYDGYGQRINVKFEVLELTPAGNQSIGEYRKNQLFIERPPITQAEIAEETIMRNKTFKVLIATTPPYGFVKESLQKLEGNDRYEGFTIDLIDKIADILGFNYEFEVEKDYGGYDMKTGKWNGMVLKLREEKADFAICDFTISAERQQGIDFSTPFMTLGIGILYKQPSKQPPEMFSFMAVFSKEVWYYMVFVQIGLGVVMIFVGRISHKEWQNPVPCVEQPEELSNQFSFANSVWLIIGSVMQQGSEIAPIALAPRIITSVWWFFTMVIVASYVGTLVAFLTVEKNVLPFQNVEELYGHKGIAFGTKKIGTTMKFFRDSTNQMYQNMYKKMKSKGWLVEENDDGVAIAENSTYAFFMESTSIEYTTERHCDLLQVGDLLDSKSYGIGMIKGSPYKKYIDDALLKLKESGDIQKLKDIWWKEKRGGGKCGEKRDEENKQLGLKHMLGAFVVLGVGLLLGLVISTLDMLWGVFKRSVKYSTTFKFELIEELKFALTFSGDVKPVKRASKTSSSAETLAEAEGKDDITSLKSIGSARSTDSHKTHHSHSSRHSSGGLSVAFARRREFT